MTIKEAIETLQANYPDACYEQLREAVDVAITILKQADITEESVIDYCHRRALTIVTNEYFHKLAAAQPVWRN